MKNTNQIKIAFSSCAVLLAAVAGQAQNWPQYLGENRAAKVSFTAPKIWPKELTQKWKVTVGDGVATPALVGDRLYVFARQEGGEILRCLDVASGKEIWKSEKYDVLPAERPAQDFAGPRATPIVTDGKVVTFGLRGTLSCFDASSGKLLWRKEDFKGSYPRFFTSASPVIADGLVIAALGGQDRGGVIAYDLKSGEEKWRWANDGASYASPMLLAADGVNMVIAETDRKLVALGVKDGKELWQTEFSVPGRGYNASTPMVNGSTLIYGGSGRPTTAVKFSKEGDAMTAKELWKNAETTLQFNTPVMKDGILFGLNANNDFFCIGKDGKTTWNVSATPQPAAAIESASTNRPQQIAAGEPTGNPPPPGGRPPEGMRDGGPGGAGGPGGRGRGGPGGPGGRGGGGRGGYAQIVDAGSVLLALTPAMELIAFAPDEKAYKEVARIKVASSPTYAYPVVSGKRIFVKDQNDVTLFTVD